MNFIIFSAATILCVCFMKKTIDKSIIGWYGFLMRGCAFGKESLVAIFWIAFQGCVIFTAITHIPFTIIWK